MKRRWIILGGLAVAFVAVLSTCGGGDKAAVTVTETVSTPSTSTTSPPPPPPPPATTTTAAEASCKPNAFLPVLKDAFDGNAPKLTVVEAKVERCQKGYAQVFAVPDPSVCKPGVEFCYETEQVFLRWNGSEWTIRTSGTGISCGSETEAEIVKSAARSATRISIPRCSRCRPRTSAARSTAERCAATSSAGWSRSRPRAAPTTGSASRSRPEALPSRSARATRSSTGALRPSRTAQRGRRPASRASRARRASRAPTGPGREFTLARESWSAS